MEVPVAVAIAVAAVVPVMRLGQAEHALDRAHGAADTGADRASHDPADKARNPVAFIGSLLGSAEDALGGAGMGHGDERQRQCQKGQHERQQPTGGQGRGLNLGFPHLDSLKSGGT